MAEPHVRFTSSPAQRAWVRDIATKAALASADRILAAELLWLSTDPCEVPLVMPGWARSLPALAERIDAGYQRRQDAGPPTDRVAEQPDRWQPPTGPLTS